MKKLFFLLLVISFYGRAQFLPNPDFEVFTACPTTNAQAALATPWFNYSGSCDYINCAFTVWGATASSGTGCMLSFHNAAFSGPGFINPEYVAAPLITPLTPGISYCISWDLNNIQNPTCADFGMLFYNSATPPSAAGAFGITVVPQVLVPQAAIPANSYATFTHTFVATAAFDRVVIGPWWGGPCVGFTKIILFDNMSMIACTPLPIELISFTGSVHDDQNILKWSTQTESNNDFFTLERSNDGITYNAVTTINGAGNSNNLRSYSAVDTEPYKEVNYYRLKQTDHNSNYTYSQIIAIHSKTKGSGLSIHPNPANDHLTLRLEDEDLQNCSIKIYNLQGTFVLEKEIHESGTKIDISSLNIGLHYIQVTNNQRSVFQSFVKN